LEAIAGHVSPLLNARLHREWTQEALRERTKELICLYVVSRDIQEDLPIDELCRRAVEHLIAAMQFPEITVPVIELNGKRFTSENYTAGLAPLLDAEIGMEGGAPGHLRVYCAAERPFLTPEEQRLVKGVAEALGTWLKHKRAEEALRESEERFRQLAETMPDTVLVGQDGRNVYANPAAVRLLRAAGPEELVGLDVFAIIEPAQHEWARQQMQRTLAGEKQPPFEDRFVRLDGSLVPVEIAASVLTWQGRPALQVVVRDITERKQAEKRTQMFSQEIIAAREEERKQVSSVLHGDVGSLAVGISAHLDAIEEDLRSGKPAEVLKWMKRTRKLFDESLARLKGLAVQLRPLELDVLGLGAALRQHFSQVTKQRSSRIRFTEALGRRRVSGDAATILFRIAQEALTNAITHGRAKRVDVDLSASRKEVTLIVRDNGKGFDPSEKGERVTSQMGLRVMRETAAAAGGAFTVDSGRGKGTTVRVSLPLKTAALGPGNVTVREETVAREKTTRSAARGLRPQKGNGA
jgi:PAS domain S-box-containing protein